jgi:bifunctional non-homologous end joining protein LigD
VGRVFPRDPRVVVPPTRAPPGRPTARGAPGPPPTGDVTWVTPRLVVEIGFGEWTPAGLLRHPRYLGLREDKTAAEVRREG